MAKLCKQSTFDYIDTLLLNNLVMYRTKICVLTLTRCHFHSLYHRFLAKSSAFALSIGPLTKALQLRAFLKFWRRASSTSGMNDSLIRFLLPLTVSYSNCTLTVLVILYRVEYRRVYSILTSIFSYEQSRLCQADLAFLYVLV